MLLGRTSRTPVMRATSWLDYDRIDGLREAICREPAGLGQALMNLKVPYLRSLLFWGRPTQGGGAIARATLTQMLGREANTAVGPLLEAPKSAAPAADVAAHPLLLEQSAVVEVSLLCFLPTAECVIDSKELKFGETVCILRRDRREPGTIVILRRDFLPFFAIDEI